MCLPFKARHHEGHRVYSRRDFAPRPKLRLPLLLLSGKLLSELYLVHSTEPLQHLVTVVDEYDRLKCCSVKAAKDNKLTDYLIASRRTMIDYKRIGPHDGARLIMYEDGRYKTVLCEKC